MRRGNGRRQTPTEAIAGYRHVSCLELLPVGHLQRETCRRFESDLDARADLKLRAFANALGSPCATPQSGAGADGLTECTRQMARIEKPTGAGNLRESFVGS